MRINNDVKLITCLIICAVLIAVIVSVKIIPSDIYWNLSPRNLAVRHLINCIHSANVEEVDSILKNDPMISYKRDSDGRDMFSVARLSYNYNVIRVFIKYGRSMNEKDSFGCTYLHDVIERGNLRLIALSLRAGANPNQQDNFGQTPLHYAVIRNNVSAVKMVINQNNINIRDDANRSPIYYVHNSDIASILVKYNPDLIQRDTLGARPLDVIRDDESIKVITRYITLKH